ncbi:MAG TPA: hypothetical protein VH704_03940 [Casimicrobiaceae bacterium]|nr:hypothetical protein [Casimicrobiaceae bacterium]
MNGIKGLLCLVGVALVCIPSSGRAADSAPRTYAVISLIGDKINVVGYRATTGSNMDRNRQGAIAVQGRTLDDIAVVAASNAIGRFDPRASIIMLASNDPALYELQDDIFEPTERSRALLGSAIKGPVQAQHATHLILIRKHRGDAAMRMQVQFVGSGKIEGVGFYVDPTLRTRSFETSEIGTGFLAAFAYVKVTLVDATTMAVIGEQTAEESATTFTGKSLNPLDALTPAQKTAALRTMIIRATESGVKAVLESK